MEINRCPGTLAAGFTTFSRTCIKRVFNGSKVNHILPYVSLQSNHNSEDSFEENASRISISGVQEKFSIIQLKNKIRLTKEGDQGSHILKPIPSGSKNADQMPANEHLTMQIARQVYGIETAENALIFFKDGTPAYITKRFDVLTKIVNTVKGYAKHEAETFENVTKWRAGLPKNLSLAEKQEFMGKMDINLYKKLIIIEFMINNTNEILLLGQLPLWYITNIHIKEGYRKPNTLIIFFMMSR